MREREGLSNNLMFKFHLVYIFNGGSIIRKVNYVLSRNMQH